MSRVILYPFKMGSAGCKALQAALKARGVRCLRSNITSERSRYRHRRTDTVVQWGNAPPTQYLPVLNRTAGIASNKLTAFEAMRTSTQTPRVPEWTTSQEFAQQWCNDGATILARTKLSANSGDGIVVYTTGDTVGPAPLYTKYVKKAREFRIHVFDGAVIHMQEKKRRSGVEGVDNMVRNSANGWVFCVQDVVPPQDVLDQATAAVGALGLTFGAVDVIYNNHYEKAYVLEVNTAPGLEGTTVEKYADAIIAYANGT